MIAEAYGVMRDGMGMSADAVGTTFATWDNGPLDSYLTEISAKVAKAADPETGKPMLDVIVDAAGQKGTGRWTVIEAQHLAAPIPAIDAAVVARNLSSQRANRTHGQDLFGAAPQPIDGVSLDDLEGALIAGKIICYAQGFEMIRKASDQFDWALPLPDIARVWREGCIIRSKMLNDMAEALTDDADRNLMFAPFFADLLKTHHDALRRVVAAAAIAGVAMPALASGLAYFDAMRTARGTANMIQGQRDFFGAHGFERFDGRHDQHGPWGA
jgi:6-phosphogluconate dehydrogenase